MTSKKREFDKVSHSATGRVDTSKKGGHGTWGSDQEQMQQGRNDFAFGKSGGQGGQGGQGRPSKDPETLRDLNQVGSEESKADAVSFETFQKQHGRNTVKPYAVDTKKGKKRNPKNRSHVQKVTDSLFSGEYGGNSKKNRNKNNRNKRGGKQKNQNKNDLNNPANKQKNRKAKEVLVTSVSYEAPQSGRGRGGRGRGDRNYGGRGRGRGGNRGGYNNYNYQSRRGGGFGSRGRGRKMEVNNNLNNNYPIANPRPQQYRKVDPSSKGGQSNNNNNNNNNNNSGNKSGQSQNAPNAQ